MFEPSDVFTHISRLLLDMEERSERSKRDFQRRRISYDFFDIDDA